MELTNKQQKGLNIALERYKNNEKYTVISGYAGTGKSTLVKFIINALEVNDDDVAYAAFTGKAAEVLRKKGNPNSMTLHKLLYDHVPKASGGFIRKVKLSIPYKVVVVDEVSMVTKDMINLLLNHNAYIIFLGDPFQLPQIDKNQSHDLLDHPHIFLDEVMRQAAESEIIRLTMDIRDGKSISFSQGKEVMVVPKNDLVTGHLTWADQILCATNATKDKINNQMREILGYSGEPQIGEKIICLKNYWDDIADDDSPLVNGMVGTIKELEENFIVIPRYAKISKTKIPIYNTIFEYGDAIFYDLNIDKSMIETGNYSLDWKDSFKLGKLKNRVGDLIPKEFAFGYCITCHKAQGSEWDKVLVLEENFPFDKTEHARWLYTAATRASEKLVLVR